MTVVDVDIKRSPRDLGKLELISMSESFERHWEVINVKSALSFRISVHDVC